MLKKLLVFTLVLALTLSCASFVSAEKSPPTLLEKPQSPALWQSHESTLEFRWTNPASILQIADDVNESEYPASFYYLVDWKKMMAVGISLLRPATQAGMTTFMDNLGGICPV